MCNITFGVMLHEDIMKKGTDHATRPLLILGHTSSSGMAMNSTMGSRVNGVSVFGFRL